MTNDELKEKANSIVAGLFTGLIMPVLAFFVYYKFFFGYMNFEKFYNQIFIYAVSQIISLCLIINLAVFFIFIQLEFYYACRGIILASFLYGGVIVYLKFIA